ncbi:MAG: SRPBCC family protein [Actinomycetota bacterium]|nr:MAG: SRPBCC family protein [Actinomycetota bacterium]
MLYADGPSVAVETLVHAPIGRVWALVTDIDLPARFSEELQGVEWLDHPHRAPGVGSRFTGRNAHRYAGEWETISVVTRWDVEAAFEWAVGDADFPSARWRFSLDRVGDDVVLRQWAQLGPAPSGLTPAIEAMPDKEEQIVARRLGEHRANMQRTVEGIKQLAEEG